MRDDKGAPVRCEDYRAARLAGDTSPAVAGHLASCGECHELEPTLAAAAAALTDTAVWEEPGQDLEDRIVAAIGGPEHEAPDTPAATPPAPRNRLPLLVASWAAAVAVVVLVAFAVTGGPAPDWETGLVGTELAPAAQATVFGWNEEAGTRMLVDIEGLEPAPPGFVYEFWLSDGPIHISAGTFHSPGEVELWAGVSRGDFPRLWVTLEPIDEDESPSMTVLDTPGSG